MNTTLNLSKIFIFAAGAVTGSAVTWYFLKTKYERIAQEEIDSVKAEFSRKENDISEPELKCEHADEPIGEVDVIYEVGDGVEITVTKKDPDIREYASKLKDMDYTDYSNMEKPVVRKKEVDDVSDKYVISPDDFDEAGFDTTTLIYRPNGILEDTMGNEIGDATDFFGIDPEDHFGEYEDDSVFIRDRANKIDYEILRTEEE